MKVLWHNLLPRRGTALIVGLMVFIVVFLLIYRLGSLVGGLSQSELEVAITPVGWHGIYHQPFFLPLQFLHSVFDSLITHHGKFVTRLPSALIGGLAIVIFALVVRLWHNSRTALLSTALFATSAWTLHVSRIANDSVMYLLALPMLLLATIILQKSPTNVFRLPIYLAIIGLLLYIPGLIWFVVATCYWQRQRIAEAWRSLPTWKYRIASAAAIVVWLPLLIVDLLRPGQLLIWLGLPHHFANIFSLSKHFLAVFVHIFIRGPQYPEQWLSRLPILDALTLCAAILGIYFYGRHWRASRSRLLAMYFVIGVTLVAIGGPVDLSVLVPLLYLAAAAGIAYLLREWLVVFPLNSFARYFGIGLISLAVGLSCLYNLRAYFVAWPHNSVTTATFRYYPMR